MPSGSMARRVARLEAAPGGTRGPCRRCGGIGRVTIVNAAEGQTVEAARGCPSCGKISKVILLERGEGEAGA